MATLTFRNLAQKILWESEIVGQLSDGHWENSRPHDHWKAWSNAKVEIGEKVGRDFSVKREQYALRSKFLLDIVGKRMLTQVRLGLKYGADKMDLFASAFDIDGNFRGIPGPECTGKYWDELRAKMATMDAELEEIKTVAADETYSRKDMLRDLKDMQAIMRTYITAHGTVIGPAAPPDEV
jgi:hypothetical protein